jgi:hypothetical protein
VFVGDGRRVRDPVRCPVADLLVEFCAHQREVGIRGGRLGEEVLQQFPGGDQQLFRGDHRDDLEQARRVEHLLVAVACPDVPIGGRQRELGDGEADPFEGGEVRTGQSVVERVESGLHGPVARGVPGDLERVQERPRKQRHGAPSPRHPAVHAPDSPGD